MAGINQHSSGQNIAAYFMFASRIYPFSSLRSTSPISLSLFLELLSAVLDQMRSSVKIVGQRFAWQGLGFLLFFFYYTFIEI